MRFWRFALTVSCANLYPINIEREREDAEAKKENTEQTARYPVFIRLWLNWTFIFAVFGILHAYYIFHSLYIYTYTCRVIYRNKKNVRFSWRFTTWDVIVSKICVFQIYSKPWCIQWISYTYLCQNCPNKSQQKVD